MDVLLITVGSSATVVRNRAAKHARLFIEGAALEACFGSYGKVPLVEFAGAIWWRDAMRWVGPKRGDARYGEFSLGFTYANVQHERYASEGSELRQRFWCEATRDISMFALATWSSFPMRPTEGTPLASFVERCARYYWDEILSVRSRFAPEGHPFDSMLKFGLLSDAAIEGPPPSSLPQLSELSES